MTSQRWQQIEQLYHSALGQEESQRTAFLKMVQGKMEGFLSLVWGHLGEAPDAIRTALDLVLRRKALGAESLAAQPRPNGVVTRISEGANPR